VYAKIIMIALIIGVILACYYSLNRQAFDCHFFPEEKLRSFNYEEDTTDEVKARLMQLFNIDKLLDVYGDSSTLSWDNEQTPGYSYDFNFAHGNLIETSVDVANLPPTGADLLRCLGAPDYYAVEVGYRHEKMLDLTLWYVSKGIMAKSYQPAPNRVDGHLPFQFLFVKRPFDKEALTTTFFSLRLDEESRKKIAAEQRAKLKIWPGSWDKLEITQ